ncbi:hypothetical protein ACJX0J_007822, partial [Zea mays]
MILSHIIMRSKIFIIRQGFLTPNVIAPVTKTLKNLRKPKIVATKTLFAITGGYGPGSILFAGVDEELSNYRKHHITGSLLSNYRKHHITGSLKKVESFEEALEVKMKDEKMMNKVSKMKTNHKDD